MKKRIIYQGMLLLLLFIYGCRNNSAVNLYELVSAGSIRNSGKDTLSAVPAGNGNFTFAADITGLQTFPELYSNDYSLITTSDWFSKDTAYNNLGIIGLTILKTDGSEISFADIENPVQRLDLWTGEIESRFDIEGVPVQIKTVCHPDYDMVSFKITSGLIEKYRLRIKISFPTAVSLQSSSVLRSAEVFKTTVIPDTNNLTIFKRDNGTENYEIIVWCNNSELKALSGNVYNILPVKADTVYSFTCQFLNKSENGRVQTFGETEAASRKFWYKFWNDAIRTGLITDKDIHDKRLIKHVILSRYLNKLKYKF
jgi:protein-glucosylgalactosylhydroxylysine glucosidase